MADNEGGNAGCLCPGAGVVGRGPRESLGSRAACLVPMSTYARTPGPPRGGRVAIGLSNHVWRVGVCGVYSHGVNPGGSSQWRQ
jgi:hypothetical protein